MNQSPIQYSGGLAKITRLSISFTQFENHHRCGSELAGRNILLLKKVFDVFYHFFITFKGNFVNIFTLILFLKSTLLFFF